MHAFSSSGQPVTAVAAVSSRTSQAKTVPLPHNEMINSASPNTKKLWWPAFDAGKQVQNVDLSWDCARGIIESGQWQWTDNCDTGELMNLTRQFVSSVLTCEDQDISMLATLASNVRRYLSETRINGIFLHDTFSSYMRATTIQCFDRFWSSFHLKKIHLLAMTEGIKWMQSALNICSFMGEMNCHKFVSRDDTRKCIGTLFEDVPTLEHIMAVEKVLKHAGPRFWRSTTGLTVEEDTEGFLQALRGVSATADLNMMGEISGRYLVIPSLRLYMRSLVSRIEANVMENRDLLRRGNNQ